MEQFKVDLKAFLIEYCQQLSLMPLQSHLWTRIVREKDSGSFPQEMRTNFSGSLLHFRMSTRENKIPAFYHLFKTIREDPKLRDFILVDAGGKPVTGEESEASWLDNIFCSNLLYAYTERAGGFQFDEQVFNQLFNEIRRDIESSDITVTELSPLMNVEIESDQVQIDNDIRLRRLSTNELEGWLNMESSIIPQPISILELVRLQSAVEVVYRRERYSAFVLGPPEKVTRLITAIRIITDASPYLIFTKMRTSSLFTPGPGGTYWGRMPVTWYGPLAIIDKSKESILTALYRRLDSSPSINKLRLSIARWNSAADRLTEEDKLIDYWIALESMFVPDTTQELSYRTALRIAAFLGTNGEERNQIYGQMKESYSLRSEIVHGHIRKQKRKVGSTELINLSRSYLRKALLKILESSHRFDPSKLEAQLLEKE